MITAKKLCTAFGIRLPAFLDGQPDTSYYPLLSLCIARELSKRRKLPEYNTVDDAVSLLQKSKNIIVLTGAGVSHFVWKSFGCKLTGLSRYRPVSVFLTFDPKRRGFIHSSSILASVIHKRFSILAYFEKIPVSFIQLRKTYYHPPTSILPPTHSYVCYRKGVNYSRILLKILITSRDMRAYFQKNLYSAMARLQRRHV